MIAEVTDQVGVVPLEAVLARQSVRAFCRDRRLWVARTSRAMTVREIDLVSIWRTVTL
jgi:hypothetical protein